MIALEDLTGIRSGMKVRRKQRRNHHSWAFYQLRTFIAYKALLAGVEVFLVDPAYTSQTCSCCGERGQRKSLLFTCKKCGDFDADINAAKNIAFRGLRRQARKPAAS
jgi:transposase